MQCGLASGFIIAAKLSLLHTMQQFNILTNLSKLSETLVQMVSGGTSLQ